MAKSDIGGQESAVASARNYASGQAGQILPQAVSGYQNFATTGGVTPQQQTLTEKQAQGSASSVFDALKQNLDRRAAIQGGYSPGYGANAATLGRKGAEASSEAVNQADLGLLQQIQSGKLAGLGGLSNIGSLYQSQIPQYLGIGANLAENKPGWMDMVSQFENILTKPFSAIGSGMSGGTSSGLSNW